MYAMCSLISFPAHEGRPALKIRMVSEVTTDKSWDNLMDEVEITLPKNLRAYAKALKELGKTRISELFRRDDPVVVQLGYNGQLSTEFEGYVSSVSANIPLVIKLEDEMRQLKKKKLNLSYESVSLKDLIKDIAPGYEHDVIEATLGQVTFKNMTAAEILASLKDSGIYSYFKGKKLIVGKVYTDDIEEESVNINLDRNVKDNTLEYVEAGQVPIQIKATSTKLNGDKITVTVGESGGEEHNIQHFGVESESELKTLAELDLSRRNSDGYRGDLTAFGWPIIRHGMVINIDSIRYPERQMEATMPKERQVRSPLEAGPGQ